MSVREIKKNQVYQIEIPIAYRTDGTRKRHFETYYGGKKDALLREAKLKIEFKTGNFPEKQNINLEMFSGEYLAYQKPLLSPKTYKTYSDRVKIINEHIGYIKLKNLNAKILDKFYNYLRDKHINKNGKYYSPTTIQAYYLLINNMLQVAVKWEYISNNPNVRIEKPKRARANISCYSTEETAKLLECLSNESLKYQAIIVLALDLSCRRGELTGLTWNDIDLETGKVVINKATQYIDKRIYEKETKSVNSDRINFINPYTIDLLKRYKKEQLEKQLKLGSKWVKTNRIFTTDFGGNIHPDTPSKILKKIVKKYNLKYITFHGLRHTGISHMIERGFQAQIICRKVGHSSVQVTDTYYSHFFEDEFKQAANSMDDIFEKVQ